MKTSLTPPIIKRARLRRLRHTDPTVAGGIYKATNGGLASALCLAMLLTPTTPASATERQTLRGHVPQPMTRLNLQPLGRLPSTNRLHLAIGLPQRNTNALNKLLRAMYDPASPQWDALTSSADGYKVLVAGNQSVALLPSSPTALSPPSPRLSIGSTSAHPVVSWLVPSSSFVLQQSSDLSSGSWVDVTNQPTLNFTNLHIQVTLPPPSGNSFYRLKEQ